MTPASFRVKVALLGTDSRNGQVSEPQEDGFTLLQTSRRQEKAWSRVGAGTEVCQRQII